jgi:hypothetical protein
MTRDHFGRRAAAYRRGMALLIVLAAAMIIAWGFTVKSGKVWPVEETTEQHK